MRGVRTLFIRQRIAARGASLVEAMVGALVALITVLVILATLATAEGRKRNAVGAADAQQTGLVTLESLGREIANAGSGLASSARELDTCPDTGDIRTSLRPLPVLVTAGANASAPDTLVVNHGAATGHGASVPFAADASAGFPYRVKSPFGLAANDMMVAMSLGGACALTTATTVSAVDADGVVDVAHAGAPENYPATSRLLNLGPRGRAVRVRYDVSGDALRSLDLYTAGAAPNPLASGIVNFKVQYGIDSDGDGALDTWAGGDVAPWTPAALLPAPAATLARIKALRLGLIVRSETFDRDVAGPFNWVLFDCAAMDKTLCAGRITGTLPAGWRYRVHEATVLLRNAIWNSPP